MPRRPRIFVAGAWYHVYCRVARGERVFAEPDEAAALRAVIREVKREHGLGIAAWCIMASHYHLAVRAGRTPLWRSMRLIQGRFAKSYNRRHRVLGPFWQGRYKAILVEDERYLQQLIAYIHLNPVSAGMAKDPAEFTWSGHRELLGLTRDPLADVDEALLLFGSQRAAARQGYVRILRGAREAEWIGEDAGSLPWWRGRGDENEPVASEGGVVRLDALGASTVSAHRKWAVDDYLAVGCRLLGGEPGGLRGRGKGVRLTRMRELLTVVGVEVYGLRVNELAVGLGMNAGSASRLLRRAVERQREDEGYRRERLELEARLCEAESALMPAKKVRR